MTSRQHLPVPILGISETKWRTFYFSITGPLCEELLMLWGHTHKQPFLSLQIIVIRQVIRF